MLRGWTITPSPASAAALSPLRLPEVQTIRQARPARSSASIAAARVMLGGGKAIRAARRPDQRLAVHRPAAGPAQTPLGQHQIQQAVIQHAVQRARERDGDFQIDGRVVAHEAFQHPAEPAGDEVFRGAEAQPAMEFAGGEMRSGAASMARAKPSMASPSVVSDRWWVSRSINRRPAAASSRATCWLTVDWPSPSPRAAAVKLPASATAMKLRS
jgi:hypothetical protein